MFFSPTFGKSRAGLVLVIQTVFNLNTSLLLLSLTFIKNNHNKFCGVKQWIFNNARG